MRSLAIRRAQQTTKPVIGFLSISYRDYYRDRDDYRGPRAEFYQLDRWLHRGWYNGDRTVIIKRHHHWDD
jgi:hypothetical protein